MITDNVLTGAWFQLIERDFSNTNIGKIIDRKVEPNGNIITIYVDISNDYMVDIKVTNMKFNHYKTYRDKETINDVLLHLNEHRQYMSKEWAYLFNKIFFNCLFN